MARNEIGSARQSQLVTTYGVGSLIPAGDQCFMVCGIDSWDESRAEPVEEPRLALSLGVDGFRAPPTTGRRDVPVTRFPVMHYCAGCRRLGKPSDLGATRDRLECHACSRELTPSRFVACCEDGHIEDFPYFQWVHSRQQNDGTGRHELKIAARGESSSLADIEISCSCGVRPVSMNGSFGKGALREITRCHGLRPWLLDAEPQDCDKPLRALQRGSSNVWFGTVASAISIPPWSGEAARLVDKHWNLLRGLDDQALRQAAESVSATGRVKSAEIIGLVRRRKGMASDHAPTERELRRDEYDALCSSNDTDAADNFLCREVSVANEIADLVAQVGEVSRLREVRALQGFSRVNPVPTPEETKHVTALSLHRPTWLPAVEVIGEGVFVRTHADILADWEQADPVRTRIRMINDAQARRDQEFNLPPSPPVSARFVVLHSLAHAVLQEMSMDAGYPAGSLRERVYAEDDQSGFLIYTASSDSAGSLGGLAALAEEKRFGTVLVNALHRAEWCSADPVCAESGPSGADGLNLAACHACLLLPETSCEHRNQFLDRVMIIGDLDLPGSGFAEMILE